MDSGSSRRAEPWLMPATHLEVDDFSLGWLANDVVDLVAGTLDGRRWLESAPFDSVTYGILFRAAPRAKPSFRIRGRQLEYDSVLDVRTLPTEQSQQAWWLFKEVLLGLEGIGEKYRIGSPPLVLAPAVEDDRDERSETPPVSPYAPSDVEPDLAALDEDEVLLVLPVAADHENEQQAAARRARHEAAFTGLLGPARASSWSGNAYTITFQLPPAARGPSAQ